MGPCLARRLGGAALSVAAGLSFLGGCGRSAEAAAEAEEPFSMEAIGEDSARLTVEAEAVEWLGIESEPAAAVGEPAGVVAVPSAAVLYAPDGSTFVYTAGAEHTFDRHPVTVERMDGDRTLVREGPEPGTPVVTQGAAELTGMEFGLEDE